MAAYNYVAKDARGKKVESSLDARTRYEALTLLRQQNLTVLQLFEPESLEEREAHAQEAATKARAIKRKRSIFQASAISLGDRAIFCRQLSISVSSGVPLRDALESIHGDLDSPAFKNVLHEVILDLHDGKSFSDAIAKHKRVFSPLFVSLVRAAEESGSMPQTLERMSAYMERSERLARKVKSITAYPIFVAVFFGLVCFVMTVFVLPQFQDIFDGFDHELPMLTVAVFSLNAFVLRNIALIIVGIMGLVAAFILYGKTSVGRMHIDKCTLRLPFFGDCIKKFAISKLCRNLSIMLRGGVPVTTALEISSTVCGNKVLEKSVLTARESIMSGEDIASSLGREAQFPRLVIRMVSVGEESGRLPEVLEKVADTYEDQVEGQIMVATSLFEPLIIIFFGIVILLLVLAIYMPVFTVGAGVK